MPTPNQRVGEYVLQDRISGGTFGEVWRAHHHVWADQLVAVKIPTDPDFVRNLQREGAAIHGLQHPNIVRAIGFDPYADPPYLIMEYVPGTSLRPLIQKRSLSVEQAVAVMRQVLTGLAHTHGRGIVHRDVKPENILVHERAAKDGYGAEGVVKVTDFGLGKAAAAAAGGGSIVLTTDARDPAAREIAGTLDYMAPEQRAGGASIDKRADLYACGVVLYELLTGERPAGTEVPSDLNRSVPRQLDDAFRRSYARLDKRFASAEEFLKALDAASGPPRLPGHMPHLGSPPPLSSAGDRVLNVGHGRTIRIDAATYMTVSRQLAAGNKIQAIKVLREVTGLGLAEAKDVVEWPANFPDPSAASRPAFAVPQPPASPYGSRRNCPQCRQTVESGDQFCMHCGVQLVENVRRCPQCGAYPEVADQYCIFCGQTLTMPSAEPV